jgi:hypothetical protein
MSLRALAIAASLLVAPVAVACGDDSYGGSRPSQSDLSDRIQSEVDGITEAQADCLADELLASDLSYDGLDALERNIDEDNVPEDERDAAEAAMSEAAMACVDR